MEYMRKVIACCVPDRVKPLDKTTDDREEDTTHEKCYVCQYAKPDSQSRCKCAWLSLCNDCVDKACNPCLHCGTCVIQDDSIARSMEELQCLARACREMAMLDDVDGGDNVENLRRMTFESIITMAVHYNRDDLYQMLKKQGLTKVNSFLENRIELLPMCENMGLQKTFMREFKSFLPAKRKHNAQADNDMVSLNCWVVTKRSKPVRCVLRVGHIV